MGSVERGLWFVVAAVLGGMVVAGRREESGLRRAAPVVKHNTPSRARSEPGTRLTMEALHEQGGVPRGWQPTLAPGDVAAGREAFARLGCERCHRVDDSNGSDGMVPPSTPVAVGPSLAGMGSHHPPTYFAEAILNPDAVLVDGPGYVDATGHSTMPSYEDLTIGELSDLVAYLGSLTATGATSCHGAASGVAAASSPTVTSGVGGPSLELGSVDLTDRPHSADRQATAFFAQTYDVAPGRLAEFEQWFAAEARPLLADYDGVAGMDTFVDATKPRAAITSSIRFRDEAALRTFMRDPRTADLWQRFDAFVGVHGHHATGLPLVYRAPSLSLP